MTTEPDTVASAICMWVPAVYGNRFWYGGGDRMPVNALEIPSICACVNATSCGHGEKKNVSEEVPESLSHVGGLCGSDVNTKLNKRSSVRLKTDTNIDGFRQNGSVCFSKTVLWSLLPLLNLPPLMTQSLQRLAPGFHCHELQLQTSPADRRPRVRVTNTPVFYKSRAPGCDI